MGRGGYEQVNAIAVDYVDNLYIAGGSSGEEAVLAKYSSDGNKVWSHIKEKIYYSSIVVDGENNIYCGSGGSTHLVTKFSSDGKMMWNTNDAGETEWGAAGIALDSYGNIYVCGGSKENHLMKIPASEME